VSRAELPNLLRTHRLFCALCWSNRWGETLARARLPRAAASDPDLGSLPLRPA